MGSVFVTNTNDFQHQDRFDGVDFLFPSNEKVLIPTDAAVHMFGYQQPDKSETLVRLGWAMRYDPTTKNFEEDKEGVRKLANFVFEEAVMVSKSSVERRQPEIA
jgi:hypothetical protein